MWLDLKIFTADKGLEIKNNMQNTNESTPPFVSVIMAGGSGTRFWPLSKKTFPKQYLKLFGNRTLIQQTADRLIPISGNDKIFICSGKSQAPLLKDQLPEIKNLILEPMARNTAPCLMLTVSHLLKKGFPLSTVMLVLPADHYIGDENRFREVLSRAVAFAGRTDSLVTLGIVPTSPHTGYGYIESGEPVEPNILKTRRFVEKPNLEKAQEFLKSKSFFWNAGIFAWSLASIVKAFEAYVPEDWKLIQTAHTDAEILAAFQKMKAQPIDTAVFEKARNVFTVPAEGIQWSDVGSWNALYEMQATSNPNVVVQGHVDAFESQGCLVNVSPERKIALVGVKDLVIVENDGILMIASREKDQLVRSAAEKLDT